VVMSLGRASPEGIIYKLLPYEDLSPSDAGAAALMFQVMFHPAGSTLPASCGLWLDSGICS